MTKPKTRVVVSSNGIARELLAIRENANGDLQVIPRTHGHNPLAVNGERDALGRPAVIKKSDANRIVEEHISFHRSLRAATKAITVARTVVTQDNRKLTHSAMVAGFSEASFFPAFVRLCGKVTNATHDHAPRTRDCVVHVGHLDGRTHTVLVSAVVSGKNVDASFLARPHSTVSVVEFKHFNIILYCSRIAWPGLNFAKTTFAISAPAKIDGENITEHERKPLDAMNAAEVSNCLDDSYKLLMKATAEAVAARNFPNLVFEMKDNIYRALPRLPMLLK